MQTVKNVVLVHGAWADGSSWSKIIPLLQAKGLHVTAVQNPLTSIADDVAATHRIINAQDGQVLLAGHSYGGAVITEAGNNPKVAGLVYVAAFAPDEGETLAGLAKNFPASPLFGELQPIEDGFSSAHTERRAGGFRAGSLCCLEKPAGCDPGGDAECVIGDAHHHCRLAYQAQLVCHSLQRPRHLARAGDQHG
jgi:pimeloyl-ACP methyl ester carboxylesterase